MTAIKIHCPHKDLSSKNCYFFISRTEAMIKFIGINPKYSSKFRESIQRFVRHIFVEKQLASD